MGQNKFRELLMESSFAVPLVKSHPGLNVPARTKLDPLVHRVRNFSLKKGAPLSPEENKARDAELMQAARKFEGLFIHQMLKAMRNTVPESGLFDSFAMKQYESMLDEEIAQEMAKHKGLGLADTFYHQFKRLAEKADDLV
jgi:Rod binding domain-containing protein